MNHYTSNLIDKLEQRVVNLGWYYPYDWKKAELREKSLKIFRIAGSVKKIYEIRLEFKKPLGHKRWVKYALLLSSTTKHVYNRWNPYEVHDNIICYYYKPGHFSFSLSPEEALGFDLVEWLKFYLSIKKEASGDEK